MRIDQHPDILAAAQHLLDSQPFSTHLGAKVTVFGDDHATIELENKPEYAQQDGHLHGGVLAYLAENAIMFAAGTVLGPVILNSALNIDFVRPAHGPRVTAEAKVVHGGNRHAVCQCAVYSYSTEGDRTLVAVAQGSARTHAG